MEEMSHYPMDDPDQLIEAATDFANHPGVHSDAAVMQFLFRFPITVLLNTLESKTDYPGLQTAVVACLERIFKTKYGASLIPRYMAFLQVGLKADTEDIRCLACRTITCLLENSGKDAAHAIHLICEYDLYPLLLDCLVNGNEEVAGASTDAIKKLAGFPEGIDIIFPVDNREATHLGNLAARCSSLGRVRVLSLIVKLFSASSSVASAIYKSNLLNLLEAEVRDSKDTLVTLSVLELLYEVLIDQFLCLPYLFILSVFLFSSEKTCLLKVEPSIYDQSVTPQQPQTQKHYLQKLHSHSQNLDTITSHWDNTSTRNFGSSTY